MLDHDDDVRQASFAERLRAGMELRGWKNPDLAKAVGVPPETVSQWRGGRQMPGWENYFAIERALKLPPGWLWQTRPPTQIALKQLNLAPDAPNEDAEGNPGVHPTTSYSVEDALQAAEQIEEIEERAHRERPGGHPSGGVQRQA